MNSEERAQLREKALKATEGPWDFDDHSDWINTANPYVVLGLLEELETLEKVNERLRSVSIVCGAPAPDRTGRRCDKPKGHDGDHWTYGGNEKT